MERWFASGNFRNIGVCTGRLSQLLVVDIDPRHDGERSERSLGLQRRDASVITGTGGVHYYYRYGGNGFRNAAGRWPGIDFRGEGGYVAAPPSIHPDTQQEYRWINDAISDQVPTWILDGVAQPAKRELNVAHRYYAGVPSYRLPSLVPVRLGSRNHEAARLAGRLVWRGLPAERCLEILRLWNSENQPPLKDSELVRTFQSIMETHQRNHTSS